MNGPQPNRFIGNAQGSLLAAGPFLGAGALHTASASAWTDVCAGGLLLRRVEAQGVHCNLHYPLLICALLVGLCIGFMTHHKGDQQATKTRLFGLPIGMQTPAETVGACLAVAQLVYTTADTASAWVRAPLPG